jgi:Spy/CpxP family protein refolding chaperone
MSTRETVGGVVVTLGLVLTVWTAEAQTLSPATHDPLGWTFSDLIDQMQGLGERFRSQLALPESAPERPLITMMLDHRRELGLTPVQVQELERLRTGFQRDAIKLEADQRVAQIDLGTLLGADPVDLAKVEAKVRDIERFRGDLRIARIRAIEQAKAQLTAEQRSRLVSLLGEPGTPRAGGGVPAPMQQAPRRL